MTMNHRVVLIGMALLASDLAPASTEGAARAIYDFTMKDIDGAMRPLSEFRGKVLLVVNVASKCGFTYQYDGLEPLYKKYKDLNLKRFNQYEHLRWKHFHDRDRAGHQGSL
jgi:glutathione peroxidase